jgi:hypothetical protein
VVVYILIIQLHGFGGDLIQPHTGLTTDLSVSGMQVPPAPSISAFKEETEQSKIISVEPIMPKVDTFENILSSVDINQLTDSIDSLSKTIVQNNIKQSTELPEINIQSPDVIPIIQVDSSIPEISPVINVDVPVQEQPNIIVDNNISDLIKTPTISLTPEISVDNKINPILPTDFSQKQESVKPDIVSFEPIEKTLQSISSQLIGITSIDGEVKLINTKLNTIASDFAGEVQPLIEKQLTYPLNDTSDIPKHDTVTFNDLDELMSLQENTESDMMKVSAFKHSLRDDDPKNKGKMYWPMEQIKLLQMLVDQQNTIIELINMSIAMNGTSQKVPEPYIPQIDEQTADNIPETPAQPNQPTVSETDLGEQQEKPEKKKGFFARRKRKNW